MFADSDEVARAFRDDVARAIIMPGDVGSLLVNRVVRAREYSAFHVPITWPMPTWRVREWRLEPVAIRDGSDLAAPGYLTYLNVAVSGLTDRDRPPPDALAERSSINNQGR
jgi:hypothetical protein